MVKSKYYILLLKFYYYHYVLLILFYFILINNSLIDVGGAIGDISTKFWKEILNYETENGKLFLAENDYILLNNDSNILQSDYLFQLGKVMFWSFIHRGAWPTWLHPFHINFIMEQNINTVEIFEKLQPSLFELANKINFDYSAYNEIKDWWSNYRDIDVVSIVNLIIYLLFYFVLDY